EVSDLVASMTLLEKMPGVSDVAVFGGGLHVTVENDQSAMPKIREVLEKAGVQVPILEPIEPSLEDVFVAMIEREDRKAA
ncbi:MAG TPA: DUF4162 domain-containing protein, partial [Bryobacteraceae bacterium]|nr:DUF4162 domain-containing protein [Bryobacteraceae bacterium]